MAARSGGDGALMMSASFPARIRALAETPFIYVPSRSHWTGRLYQEGRTHGRPDFAPAATEAR